MKLLKEGKEIADIDFGEVEFGAKKELVLGLENDGEGTLTELAFKINPEIKIEGLPPKIIAPHERASIRLSWLPEISLRQPIKVKLEITGKEVFR